MEVALRKLKLDVPIVSQASKVILGGRGAAACVNLWYSAFSPFRFPKFPLEIGGHGVDSMANPMTGPHLGLILCSLYGLHSNVVQVDLRLHV